MDGAQSSDRKHGTYMRFAQLVQDVSMREGLVVAVMSIGCSRGSEPAPVPLAPTPQIVVDAAQPPPPPRAPTRIELGDCASATTTWSTGATTTPIVSPPGDHGDHGGRGAGAGGYGYGLGRIGTPGTTITPLVTLGVPAIEGGGDLPKEIIRRYLKRNLNKLAYCYEQRLIAEPNLRGTIKTQFLILPSGIVASPSSTGFDADLGKCFADVIRQIEFPKPNNGAMVKVSYPFTLNPELYRPAPHLLQPVAPPAPPQPHPNPLRSETAALEACLRDAKPGAIVVGLDYATDGKVTAAVVTGIADATVRDCVVGVAMRVTRLDPSGTAQRCPLAFGTLAVDALPAIDLGPSLTELPPIVHPPLDPILAVAPAVVVRATDDTPMTIVWDTIDQLGAAHADFVLASKHGASWQLMSPRALPDVPVPHGTAVPWNPVRPAGKPAVAIRLAGRDTYLVHGTTSDRVVAEDAIARLTALHIAGNAIEIVASETSMYGDVVAAVAAATGAGFVDWVLVRSMVSK